MKYDFLSEMALDVSDERDIDSKINTFQLKTSPWTVKASILATGLGQDNTYDTLIKNGQKENQKKGEIKIDGYPKIISRKCGLSKEWQDLILFQEEDLQYCPDFSCLINIDLKLERPFYSRDDRAFYPIDNPIKRDWSFHEPYMAAAGIKGLLRWAWDMCWLEDHSKSGISRKLFGPDKDDMTEENAQIGILYTCPIFWNGRVDLEVINPHDRHSGAGQNPIKYEVVQRGASGRLTLLLANRDESLDSLRAIIAPFWEALVFLLEDSGLSAKRSADWGQVTIEKCKAFISGLQQTGKSSQKMDSEVLSPEWDEVTDENGNLYELENQNVFTTKKINQLLPNWSKAQIKKNKKQALEEINRLWNEVQAGNQTNEEKNEGKNNSKRSVLKLEAKNIVELGKEIKKSLDQKGEG